MSIRKIVSAVALLLVAVPVFAADGFEDGLRYYVSGKTDSALAVWRPLAEGGHANAQFHLGNMYDKGEGVAQNTNEAMKWYSLAASQGHQTASYRVHVMELDKRRTARR